MTKLNVDIQTAAHDEMSTKNGAVVVIEPSTGNVLALSLIHIFRNSILKAMIWMTWEISSAICLEECFMAEAEIQGGAAIR